MGADSIGVDGRTARTLTEALDLVERAKQDVRENVGYEKEQAREALEACVSEELLPALLDAVEDLDEAKDIIAVAKFVNRRRDP